MIRDRKPNGSLALSPVWLSDLSWVPEGFWWGCKRGLCTLDRLGHKPAKAQEWPKQGPGGAPFSLVWAVCRGTEGTGASVKHTELLQSGAAKYNCVGLALCTSCPTSANPITRPKIWICPCQIVMSFCCAVSRKRKQSSWGAALCPSLLFLGLNWGVVPPFPRPLASRCAQLSWWERKGSVSAPAAPESAVWDWMGSAGKFGCVWLFADWRESKKFVFHSQIGEQRHPHF